MPAASGWRAVPLLLTIATWQLSMTFVPSRLEFLFAVYGSNDVQMIDWSRSERRPLSRVFAQPDVRSIRYERPCMRSAHESRYIMMTKGYAQNPKFSKRRSRSCILERLNPSTILVRLVCAFQSGVV